MRAAAKDRAGTYPHLLRRKAKAIEQNVPFSTGPLATLDRPAVMTCRTVMDVGHMD